MPFELTTEIIAILGIVSILFIWNIIISLKLKKANKRFNNMITNYSEDFNLEKMLFNVAKEVSAFRKELNENVSVCAEANNKTNEKFDKKIKDIQDDLSKETTILKEMIEVINKNLQICIQKTHVIRYNPFENVGGELCFALAALDKKNDGFILNTIFTESGSYTYCKGVNNGVSSIKLSKEEQEALNLAKNKVC